MRAICSLVAALAAVISVAGTAIAAEPVDLLLVLASDVSHSIDTVKFKLQRDGYIAALSDPRVIEVIRSGPHGRIAICFVEWSGGEEQRVVIDWTLVDGAKAAHNLVSQLDEALTLVCQFHFDQRRYRLCDGAAEACAIPLGTPNNRCVW